MWRDALPYAEWPFSLHGVAALPTRGKQFPYTRGTVSLHGAKGFPARVRREWYKQRKENEMTVKFITVKGPDRLASRYSAHFGSYLNKYV